MDTNRILFLAGVLAEDVRPGGTLKRRAGADDKEMKGGTVQLSGKAGAYMKGQAVGQTQKHIWDMIRRIKDHGENANDVKMEFKKYVETLPQENQQKSIDYFQTHLKGYTGA